MIEMSCEFLFEQQLLINAQNPPGISFSLVKNLVNTFFLNFEYFLQFAMTNIRLKYISRQFRTFIFNQCLNQYFSTIQQSVYATKLKHTAFGCPEGSILRRFCSKQVQWIALRLNGWIAWSLKRFCEDCLKKLLSSNKTDLSIYAIS